MQHRTTTRQILYTSRKPDRTGEKRERENFTFTTQGGVGGYMQPWHELDRS